MYLMSAWNMPDFELEYCYIVFHAYVEHIINYVRTYTQFIIIIGITVQFSLNKYEVKENGEPAQLVLILSKPLEYCSSSILIKFEDVTATGK